MAVKYRINFKNHDNVSCRIDISTPAYSGAIIPVKAALDESSKLAYECDDNPFEPIINSKLQLNLFSEGQVNIDELQAAGDKDFKVALYIDNLSTIYWEGFMTPQGIQKVLSSPPFSLNLTAPDGLKLLEGIKLNYPFNLASPPSIDDVIKYILGVNGLGSSLPIEYDLDLTSKDDGINIIPFHERKLVYEFLYPGDEDKQTMLHILEGIVKAASCRIYQKGGKWVIEQVLRNSLKSTLSIGRTGYLPIESLPYIITEPGLKGVDVNYNYIRTSNILTNGNLDKINTADNTPLYWDINYAASDLVESTFFGYINRADNGVKLSKANIISEKANLDANILFKSISIKLDWMPVGGFSVDEEGYLNDPEQYLFSISVLYASQNGRYWDEDTDSWVYDDPKFYYLTEFGFFRPSPFPSGILIPFKLKDISNGKPIKLGDVIEITFDKFGDIVLPDPLEITTDGSITSPTVESYLKVGITDGNPSSKTAVFGNIEIGVIDTADIYEIRNTGTSHTEVLDVDLDISTSFNSFFNTDIKSSYDKTNIAYKFNVYGKLLSLSESVGYQILRLRQKPSMIYEGSLRLPGSIKSWKYGEVYTIDGISGKKFIPLAVSYNIETCKVNARLFEFRNEDVAGFEINHVTNVSGGNSGSSTAGGGGNTGSIIQNDTLQDVTNRGSTSDHIISLKGSRNSDLLTIPGIAPTGEEPGAIWHGEGAGADPIPDYQLPIASATLLGGVKIGNGLSINPVTGVLSANADLTGYATQNWVSLNYVPQSRTINGKALTANISLNASDVGAITQVDADGRYIRNQTTLQTGANLHVVGGKFTTQLVIPAVANSEEGAIWHSIGSGSDPVPPYAIPIASATLLGGIKVGSGLSINATTGVLSVNAIDLSGYYTKAQSDARYKLSFSENTGFNKNFGTGAGTVAQGNDSRINNGQTAFSWGDFHVFGLGQTSFSDRVTTGSLDNDLIGAGFYGHSTGATGNPEPATQGSLWISKDGNGWTSEIHLSSATTNLRFRRFNGTAWTGWKKVWDNSNFNPANYALLSDTVLLTGNQSISGVKQFGTASTFLPSTTAATIANAIQFFGGTPSANAGTYMQGRDYQNNQSFVLRNYALAGTGSQLSLLLGGLDANGEVRAKTLFIDSEAAGAVSHITFNRANSYVTALDKAIHFQTKNTVIGGTNPLLSLYADQTIEARGQLNAITLKATTELIIPVTAGTTNNAIWQA